MTETKTEEVKRPAASGSKKDWAAFAASLGIEVENETRDQIVELVRVHESKTEQVNVAATGGDLTTTVEAGLPPQHTSEGYGTGDDAEPAKGRTYPELPQSYPTEDGEYYVNVARAWGPITVGVVPEGWHGAAPLQMPLADVEKVRDLLTKVLEEHEGQL